MIKKDVKKILLLIIISMIMFNFIFSNVSLANNTTSDPVKSQSGLSISDTSGLDAEMETASKLDKTVVLDGLVGIFTYFEKVKVVIVGGVFQFLATVVGESAGTVSNEGTFSVITPGDILFNRLAKTDIN